MLHGGLNRDHFQIQCLGLSLEVTPLTRNRGLTGNLAVEGGPLPCAEAKPLVHRPTPEQTHGQEGHKEAWGGSLTVSDELNFFLLLPNIVT